jgi:hypothetical protein
MVSFQNLGNIRLAAENQVPLGQTYRKLFLQYYVNHKQVLLTAGSGVKFGYFIRNHYFY